MPAKTNKAWSALELSLINKEEKISTKDAYKDYVAKCMARNGPVRSFDGFKKRRQREMKA